MMLLNQICFELLEFRPCPSTHWTDIWSDSTEEIRISKTWELDRTWQRSRERAYSHGYFNSLRPSSALLLLALFWTRSNLRWTLTLEPIFYALGHGRIFNSPTEVDPFKMPRNEQEFGVHLCNATENYFGRIAESTPATQSDQKAS